jgi:hypothetical protein
MGEEFRVTGEVYACKPERCFADRASNDSRCDSGEQELERFENVAVGSLTVAPVGDAGSRLPEKTEIKEFRLSGGRLQERLERYSALCCKAFCEWGKNRLIADDDGCR